MNNMSKLERSLQFYVLGNKLKTTVFDEKNYSVADSIFGSIILAVAMDSEFKETSNLGKIIRMLVLSEFVRLNPEYNLQENLPKGNELKKEVAEFLALETIEAKLAFKYRIWESFLVDYIKKYDSTFNGNNLFYASLKIFQPKNTEEITKYQQVFQFYYLNRKLKHKERAGWDNKHWNIKAPRRERISEHVVDTILLSIGLSSLFSYDINMDKVLETLAIHETGEVLIGDITPFDGFSKEQKLEMEHEAVKDCLGNLSLKKKYMQMFIDFDEQQTDEDTFAYFCDKEVADLQSKLYQDMGLHCTLDDQKDNRAFKSENVQKYLALGAKTPFDIWFECDRSIYENNSRFPEFFDLLVLTKNTDLTKYLSYDETLVPESLSLKLKKSKKE